MSELPDSQLDDIADRITDRILAKRRELWVDPETHYSDHQWIEEQKQEQAERRAFRRKVINSVTIWAVIIVIGFMATATFKALKQL